jgi:hypothetical protein
MSYYTLGTVFFCAILFFIHSIYRKDYLALFIHPYLLVCLFWAFAWHNRTIYPGMADYVDISIAISFILLSIGFWSAYWLLPAQFIKKRIFPCFQFCSEEENLQKITQKTYWSIFLFVSICAICIMLIRYSIASDWNELFFAGYRLRAKTTPITSLKYIGVVLGIFQYIIHGCVAILFIIPFIKDIKINKYYFQIISFLFAILWTFIFFGGGFRQPMLFVPLFIILLTFILIYHKVTFLKSFIPFLILYLIISIAMTLFAGIARSNGLPDIIKYLTGSKSKIAEKIEQATFYTRSEGHKEKIEKIYQQLVNEPEPIVENTNEPFIKNINEPIIKNTNEPVVKDTSDELLFIRQFFKLHKSNSDMAAMCFKFYGNYHPFYGFPNAIYRWSCFCVPHQFFTNGRAGKPYPLHIQAMRDIAGNVNSPSLANHPMGLWCEGYIFSGYIGAIIFSLLGGILFGFIGKLLFIKIKNDTVIRLDSLLFIPVFYSFYILMGTIVSGQIESRFIGIFCLIIVAIIVKRYKHFSLS